MSKLTSRRLIVASLLGVVALFGTCATLRASDPLRAPAFPLIANDPYFSVWSSTDELADSFPVHWTGKINALTSYVKIDGKNYRLMGRPAQFEDAAAKATQTDVTTRATNTRYTFNDAGVEITLKFTNPNLLDDLDVFARPATYLTWTVKSTDGKNHDVAIYFDASAELCVNTPDQKVIAKRVKEAPFDVLRVGTEDQKILERKGDDVRIDWGYFYVAAQKGASQSAIAGDVAARGSFLKSGVLPTTDDANFPRRANEDWPVLAYVFNCGSVGAEPVAKKLVVAYDDIYCLELKGEWLRAYWRKDGMQPVDLLAKAFEDYEALMERSAQFDASLWERAEKIGGENYAFLCSLAYPQCLAAQKLAVLPDGKLFFVSKENFSNGCAATVDLVYPASPILAVFSPTLLKASISPDLDYAMSDYWKFPFAPHDMGTYPKLNGQVYGGGEKTEENQMPVEETANLIIVTDVATRLDGNLEFALPYWDMLRGWTEYLVENGFDPADQLCTDDFAGRLARNANLSAKALVAVACFASMCERAGKTEDAKYFRAKAEEFVPKWLELAAAGDHYSLTFENPNSWSQKYNLVWDKLLDLNLFPKEVAQKEVAFYKTVLNEFGLPLDSRKEFTKTDWQVWTATLADDRADFDALMAPLYRYVSATQPRVPLTDWYHTDTARECNMQARSVVGAVFIKMLEK